MINPMIIKRVEKTSDTPYGCLVVKDVPVDRPAIVAFGGELTLDTHGANSYAKMLQKFLRFLLFALAEMRRGAYNIKKSVLGEVRSWRLAL